LAARDEPEDHRGDGEDRADLVRGEVEPERHDQGEHRSDEREDLAGSRPSRVPGWLSIAPPLTSPGRCRPGG
jgi:hypothetical protein